MFHVERPVDWRLQETSSWENLLTRRDAHVPEGWGEPDGAEDR
jgi:hypothetical protein